MSHEPVPPGRVHLDADQLEDADELEAQRETPLPPTQPDPPPTERPPSMQAAELGAPGDPAGAIMISAPQRAAQPGFWPVVVHTPPPQGAASGFWPRK